jgi:hypothetical protein
MSFSALVEAASTLCETAKHPHNTEKLFIIWSYTHRSVAKHFCEPIRPQSGEMFQKITRNLLDATSPSQLVIDMATLVCITRLFLGPKSHFPTSDILGQLDTVLETGYQQGTPVVLDRSLMSLHRVLAAQDALGRNAGLADFVSEIGLPEIMLGVNDGHIDLYWHFRLSRRVSHSGALSSTYRQVGFFPLELPPLNLRPQAPRIEAESETSDSCITVNVDALRNRMASQSREMQRAILSEVHAPGQGN